MSTVPYLPQRQLSVGEVLDLSFRIYRTTFVKCLLFATCGVIAGQLAGIYALIRGRNLAQGAAGMAGMLALMQDPTLVALYVVGLVLTLIFYAAVLLRQRAIITDGAVGGELAAALRRTPALVALVILIALGCLALFVPVFVTGGALRGLLVLAGLVVLSYGLVALSSAMTVLLVEEAGPVASVTPSCRTAFGVFWRPSVTFAAALTILLALGSIDRALAAFVAGPL